MIITDGIKGDTTAVSGGRLSTALTDANYTVPLATYRDYEFLEFTGTLTAQRDVVLPVADGAKKTVYNGANYHLTFKASGQTGVMVPPGGRVIIYSNGTDWVPAEPVRNGRFPKVMPDSDYTPSVPEARDNECLEYTGTLTGAHNVILPVLDGFTKTIFNNSDHSLTFKVTGMTGVTIATTKTAIIRGNATDYVRVTPDA